MFSNTDVLLPHSQHGTSEAIFLQQLLQKYPSTVKASSICNDVLRVLGGKDQRFCVEGIILETTAKYLDHNLRIYHVPHPKTKFRPIHNKKDNNDNDNNNNNNNNNNNSMIAKCNHKKHDTYVGFKSMKVYSIYSKLSSFEKV